MPHAYLKIDDNSIIVPYIWILSLDLKSFQFDNFGEPKPNWFQITK
jgi:hypothetical protein